MDDVTLLDHKIKSSMFSSTTSVAGFGQNPDYIFSIY